MTENTSLLPANGDAFGFADDNNSAHMARSYMLEDLQGVLTAVPNPAASNAAYRHAIIDENCLGKRSGQTRKLTVRHLIDLYALDPTVPLFHALLAEPDIQNGDYTIHWLEKWLDSQFG